MTAPHASTPPRQEIFAISALKAVAIVLVTNSHMRGFYPVAEMATGGLLGNTLFFFASGITTALGLSRRTQPFLPWYSRRVRRIYVDLWLVTGLLIALGIVSVSGAVDLLATLFFPSYYWFIPAIAVLYPICYVLIRFGSNGALPTAIAASLILYAIVYMSVVDFTRWNAEDHIGLKTFFYFAVMVAGIWAVRANPVPTRFPTAIILLILATASFYGFLAALRISGLYSVQAGANLIALAWTFAMFNALRVPQVETWLRRVAERPILFASALTLQIYIVQVPLVGQPAFQRLAFPLNVVAFVVALVLLAWLLNAVAAFVVKWLPDVRPMSPRPSERG